MVQLDPNLQLLAHIRLSIVRGISLKAAIQEFCRQHKAKISYDLTSLLISHQQNKAQYDLFDTVSDERSLVLDVIWRGLRGESIIQYLPQLESELETRAYNKLDAFFKILPIKVLLVVVFFHFPALLIISLLPIMNQILEVTK